ncbi:hypothetical protein GW17_00036712 [Ensete ventricosum]|nr:hypothetical protein GW17_00036712 [Ensete ventricosum]
MENTAALSRATPVVGWVGRSTQMCRLKSRGTVVFFCCDGYDAVLLVRFSMRNAPRIRVPNDTEGRREETHGSIPLFRRTVLGLALLGIPPTHLLGFLCSARLRCFLGSLATKQEGMHPHFMSIDSLEFFFGRDCGGLFGGVRVVESVGEGVTDLAPGDHVLPVFTGECGECAHCKSQESNMCDILRINTDRGVMIGDGQSRLADLPFLGHLYLQRVHLICSDSTCFLSPAKKFGVNEFLNPADHKKPVQEVCF